MKKLFTIVSLLFFISFSYAQNTSKQEKAKEKIEKEIAYIDKQLSTTKAQQKQSLNSLILTQKKIEARHKLLAQLDKEIKGYEGDITVKSSEIERLQRRQDTLKRYYEKMIYNSYKNRDSKVWFMYILASEDIGQGYRRWSYLKDIAISVREQADEIRQTEIKIDQEKRNLLALKTASTSSHTQKEEEYEQLSIEETQVMNSINRLTKQERKIRSQLGKKRKEIERLNTEIERILAEAVRKQRESGGKIVIDYELSAKFSKNKGRLPWPLKNGVVVEKFGQGYHPVFRTVKLPFNNGVNISTQPNQNAICVYQGVVKQILVIAGYNQCVLVQHGEYFTFYCKLKRVNVKKGQTLKLGDAIGVIDDTEDGNATLHFQLWKGTQKHNPEYWLVKR